MGCVRIEMFDPNMLLVYFREAGEEVGQDVMSAGGVIGGDKRLGEKFGESSCVRLGGSREGLSERLFERLVENFREMLCKR